LGLKVHRYKNSIIRWILLFFFIIIPLLYFGRKFFLLIKSHLEEEDLKRRSLILNAENELMQRRIEDYKKGITIEAKARDDLGMIKNGEKIYIIKR